MSDVRVIGLDIAKSVFQVHGVDAAGATVLQKRLTRSRLLPFFEKLPPCLIGIEACATSHHWARELTRLGHEVKLMPAQYVKPYVKRQKNDLADAGRRRSAISRQRWLINAHEIVAEQRTEGGSVEAPLTRPDSPARRGPAADLGRRGPAAPARPLCRFRAGIRAGNSHPRE